MKKLFLLLAAMTLAALPAAGQRGTGDASGVARQAVKPEVITLAGTVTEIKTAPCENTTGRSYLGTHLIVKTPEGETVNLHLGPAADTEEISQQLSVGDRIAFDAFRTEDMPEDALVATAITLPGQRVIELRDSTLRPYWAAGNGKGRSFQNNTAAPRGRGAGMRLRSGKQGRCW